MTTDNTAELLAAYDAQLRARVPARPPANVVYETDGPLVRSYGGHRGLLDYRDLGGLGGAELTALITRQRDFFAVRGEAVEWKTRAHDAPADLTERLSAAGFVSEERETVMIGIAREVAAEPALPPGVTLHQISDAAGLDGIAALESTVWSMDFSGWIADMAAIMKGDPETLEIFAVEAAGAVVSTGWTRYATGTEFASLWGGSTLAEWRGKGLYRAIVAHRARRAVERGFRYLQVDASEDSRPILQRLGFVAVTTTTPYVWSPSAV